MTAKCLCHGTAKLHSSAPSPISIIAAWTPAYLGITLRMETRVTGVHMNSQLHHHCKRAVFAGDHQVCASAVWRQWSVTNLCSYSWIFPLPLRGFPRRLWEGQYGLPSAKGGQNAHHTGTTKKLLSPRGHQSNVLVLQVQQPGHSNFFLLPRVLVGKYK